MSDNSNLAVDKLLNELSHQLSEGHERICHCLKQLNEEQLWWRPAPQQNTIANLILHLEGNLHQWIVSGVVNGPDIRDRPKEFSAFRTMQKSELRSKLSQTVDAAIEVISNQSAISVLEHRRIQGFETTVAGAIVESVSHFRGHTQEIISLTRQQLDERYEFYFIPESKEQGA